MRPRSEVKVKKEYKQINELDLNTFICFQREFNINVAYTSY